MVDDASVPKQRAPGPGCGAAGDVLFGPFGLLLYPDRTGLLRSRASPERVR